MNYLDAAAVLLIAFVWDIVLGEPPPELHPVVWTGRAIAFFEQIVPRSGRKLYGAFMAIFLIFSIALSGFLIVELLLSLNHLLGILLAAFLLKSTFALKSLIQAAERIAKSLEKGDVERAREQLPWLCGRDGSKLAEPQIVSAAIESTGENFVDAILSPLIYFTVFSFFGIGIFAALAFKVASTLDSMIGYRTEPYKDLGFFAAKFDDLLNFPTARISILFLSLASGFPSRAIGIALRDGNRTASPNSGYPMAAVAGALEVRLEKAGSKESYVLGQEFGAPLPRDIRRAIGILERASIASFVISFLVIYGVGGLMK